MMRGVMRGALALIAMAGGTGALIAFELWLRDMVAWWIPLLFAAGMAFASLSLGVMRGEDDVERILREHREGLEEK